MSALCSSDENRIFNEPIVHLLTSKYHFVFFVLEPCKTSSQFVGNIFSLTSSVAVFFESLLLIGLSI